MNVVIQSQERKSLALVVTPECVEVRVPQQLDPAGERVQQFIANGLARLPKDLELERERPYQTAEIQTKIDTWAEKLGVTVNRVQIRPMRRKWGSMSSQANLTLADDVRNLPEPLLEYVIVHELVHLWCANHGGEYTAVLGAHLSDWQERELSLAVWMLHKLQRVDIEVNLERTD